jgi:hypothetical protein
VSAPFKEEPQVGQTWECSLVFYDRGVRVLKGTLLLVLEMRHSPDESTLLNLETGERFDSMWGWDYYCERLT